MNNNSLAVAIRAIKAQALHEAAEAFDLFDSDWDQALVMAWLIERADEIEQAEVE